MRRYRYSIKFLLALIVSVLVLMGLNSCATNPVTGKSDFVTMTENAEIKLGRQSHQKIIEEYGGIYPDLELQEYVNRVGQSLAAVSHRNHLNFNFTVLDSPVINAFALPGGFVYITRGILAYLSTEEQLAGILGHEIGHVTARHGVRQTSLAQATDIGFQIGAILVPELQSSVGNSVAQLLGTALISGYGREHELEADRLGAIYLAKSGYNPDAMIEVIGVLKDQEIFQNKLAKEKGKPAQSYHGVFSSHPDNDKRLRKVIKAAEKFRGDVLKKPEQADFLKQLNGLVFGENEQSGVVRGSTFYHQPLNIKVDFPSSWQVKNFPDRLVSVEEGTDAFLSMVTKPFEKKLSPVRYLKRLVPEKHWLSDGDVSLEPLDGYSIIVDLPEKNGAVKRVRIAMIYHNNRAYLFTGQGKDKKSLAHYDALFLSALRSVQSLSEDELALSAALKLKIIEFSAQHSLKKLAAKSPWKDHSEDYLRLLNQIYPQGEPKPGFLFKTIE